MGKKVHPYSLRIGITKSWKSRWYAEGPKYVAYLHQDLKIKSMIKAHLRDAGISEIEIERSAGQIVINIKTSRPGVVIGRQGSSLDELRKKIITLVQSKNVDLKVEEIRKPEIEASLIAQNICHQIERRIPYRRACKQSVEKAMENNVKGCKIRVSGRLNGVEISRSEIFIQGRIPLHTLRADIDYASEAAYTTYGKIGVKVWIYKGDVFADKKKLKAMKREEDKVQEKVQEESKNEDKSGNENIIDIPSQV